MEILQKYKTWCWNNNYYVSAFPYDIEKQNGSKNVIVVVEVYKHLQVKDKWGKPKLGIQTLQQGKTDYLWYKQNIKPSTSRFDYDTRERIVKIYNSIFNTNQKNTKCMPCMKGLLENINNYLVVWEK
jgi:hypothetical protein